MKAITVYYTDGQNEYNTTVEYNTLQEAIDAVKLEFENTEYTVLENKTAEQFELDTMSNDRCKKYEILKDDYIEVDGIKVYRIRALKAFETIDLDQINVGDLGGYIEKEENLSQSGRSWVRDKAIVYDKAMVFDDAIVCNRAIVCDRAVVCDWAVVRDDARVLHRASVRERAEICDDAIVSDMACVRDRAEISNDAIVCGEAWVTGTASISGDAYVRNTNDYICINSIGNEPLTTTFFRTKANVGVTWGNFGDYLTEFEEIVKETYKDSKYAQEYLLAISLAKLHFEIAK